MDLRSSPPAIPAPLNLAVRVGCKMVYEASSNDPMLLAIKVRHDRHQLIAQESLEVTPMTAVSEFEDDHGNCILRVRLAPGQTSFIYDAIAHVPGVAEDHFYVDQPLAPEELPTDLLRYTLPSRYCDSDTLKDFAWQQFGRFQHGVERVQAITAWIHENVEYRTGSGSSVITASDAISRGFGVCRDFAHCGVALCRTFPLPARYVSGYVPDIGCLDPGSINDFHAYYEVFMGGHWQVFDARFNRPRVGRVRMATGYDAASCAFSTCYGGAKLTWFEVWSYQIDPQKVRIGDPIDLTQRLCGTVDIQHPQNV